MMNIEEKLNSLPKKELIYIFLSIPIVIFIIFYNFLYPNLEEKNKKLIKTEKKKESELSKTVSEIRKIKNSKNIIKPTRKKLENLREDFKYVNYTFNTLDLVRLNSDITYELLTKLLNKSNLLQLKSSFSISWNNKKVAPFNQYIEIKIVGKGDYVSIVKYLQFIDHMKHLIDVSKVNISIQSPDKKQAKIEDILSKEKKAESSSLSFILTKYQANTLHSFKSMAKSKHLNLSISVNKDNINYFNISFKGNYGGIQSILKMLKDISRRQNKLFEFKDVRTHLVYVTNKEVSKPKKQEFVINLDIVGIK